MKQCFYHFKNEKDRERIYRTSDSVAQIKSDMRGNQAVLDAIYNEESDEVVLYSKKWTKSDIYGNRLTEEYRD